MTPVMVYFSAHADGETRRHRSSDDRNGESRAGDRRNGYPKRKGNRKLGTGQGAGRGSLGIVERVRGQRKSSDL